MTPPSTLPSITPGNRGFWQAAARGVLALPACKRCSHTWYPPSSRCPACLSRDVEFREASGRGTLWSWVVMHKQYFEGFPPPYMVAFVKLEEGPMLMTTLTGYDPQALRCDLPVRASFERLGDEVSILKFRPA